MDELSSYSIFLFIRYDAFKFGCTSLQVPPDLLYQIRHDITVSPSGVAFVKVMILVLCDRQFHLGWLTSLRSNWYCGLYFAPLRAVRRGRGGDAVSHFPVFFRYLSECWTPGSSGNKMSSLCFHLYWRLISSIIKLYFTCALWRSNSNYLCVTLHSLPACRAECFPRKRVMVWEMKHPGLLSIVLILRYVYCWLICNELINIAWSSEQ